ncbi:hypothetical protein PENTCL1PPCAC_4639, partial [Pristionchus entomophagus]
KSKELEQKLEALTLTVRSAEEQVKAKQAEIKALIESKATAINEEKAAAESLMRKIEARDEYQEINICLGV